MPVIVGGCACVFERGGMTGIIPQFQAVLADTPGSSYPLSASTCSPADRRSTPRLGMSDAVAVSMNRKGLPNETALVLNPPRLRPMGKFGGAPAAQGCARTTVLSMIRYSRSASSRCIWAQTPSSSPTTESLVDAVPVPVFGCAGRHWAPERVSTKYPLPGQRTRRNHARNRASWPTVLVII